MAKQLPVTELFLRIGKDFYKLVPLGVDKRCAKRGWKLIKSNRTSYDVAIDSRGWFSCTCADATYREHTCKHGKAVKELGLL